MSHLVNQLLIIIALSFVAGIVSAFLLTWFLRRRRRAKHGMRELP